jgi:hypothetical protein
MTSASTDVPAGEVDTITICHPLGVRDRPVVHS